MSINLEFEARNWLIVASTRQPGSSQSKMCWISSRFALMSAMVPAHITSGDMPILYYDRGYYHPVRI